MYCLNRHDIDTKLSNTLFFDKSSILVKEYFRRYINDFINNNNTPDICYHYNYSNDKMNVILFQTTRGLSKGYLYNSLNYTTKEIAYFSVSYCDFKLNPNITMDLHYMLKKESIGTYRDLINELQLLAKKKGLLS